jgi:hypothetical protein
MAMSMSTPSLSTIVNFKVAVDDAEDSFIIDHGDAALITHPFDLNLVLRASLAYASTSVRQSLPCALSH